MGSNVIDISDGGMNILFLFINAFLQEYGADWGFTDISGFVRSINIFQAGVQLIVFSMLCFFGYKLMKLIVTINGGIIGFILGLILGSLWWEGILGFYGHISMFLILGCGLVMAIIFGKLAFKLYRFGIFLHYFLCGLFISWFFLFLLGVRNLGLLFVVSAIIGIIIGFIALAFNKMYIIISSAIVGGFCSGQAIGVLIETDKGGVVFLIGFILCVLGVVVQLWLDTKNLKEIFFSNGRGKKINTNTSFCDKCGSRIENGNKFCPSCGNDLSNKSELSKKIVHTENILPNTEKTAASMNYIFTGNEDKKNLKIRMKDALSDKRWAEAKIFAERVINTDAEDGEGYLGALMSEYNISCEDDFKTFDKDFSDNKYFKGFKKYATNDLVLLLYEYEENKKNKNNTTNLTDNLADNINELNISVENRCPVCDAELEPGAAFCIKCGNRIEKNKDISIDSKKIYCSSCGAELKEGTKFCSKCGTKL